MKVLTVFGTRPEAIKLAPVVAELKRANSVESFVCVTGQHRSMLEDVLSVFNIRADFDLRVMRDAQSLTHVTTHVLEGMERVLTETRPDWVIVQGDTTTTMAASLAAFFQRAATRSRCADRCRRT